MPATQYSPPIRYNSRIITDTLFNISPYPSIPDQGAYEFGHGDADSDGLTNYQELCYDGDCQDYNPYDAVLNPTGTDLDLVLSDTDGDSFSDSVEVAAGSNPLNPSSTPSSVAIPTLSLYMLLLLVFSALWLGWYRVASTR